VKPGDSLEMIMRSKRPKACLSQRNPPGKWWILATSMLLLALSLASNVHAEDPEGRRKYRLLRLQDENGNIPTNAWLRAAAQKKKMRFNPNAWPKREQLPSAERAGVESLGWTWLGPGNIGGRVRSLLIHPTSPNIMWVGGVSGGVWKTTTGGQSWFPLDDFMGNLGVACMAIDPTNPNIIYAGTGEVFQGAGIFKTTDGGVTWAHLSSTASPSFHYVGRLAIHPSNSQIILAATTTGIYRSTDGGGNWSLRQAKPGPYAAGFRDIDFDPGNGNKCIASGWTEEMLMFSTDGGVTWLNASGISGAGRIEVAYAPSNPNVVYASAQKNHGELYRSLDGGQTYSLRNTGNNYFLGDHDQGDYDNAIWVDPTNPNTFVVGGINSFRSVDGGSTLTQLTLAYTIHVDQHVIVNHPSFDGVNNQTVFFGNDGGVWRTANIYTASPEGGWTELNNNLGITQFYGAAGNATSGTIIGGTQDNGTLRYTPGGGTEGWTWMNGGDGGFCAADPMDTNYLYGESQYLAIVRSTDGGVSASPIAAGLTDAGSSADAPFIAPLLLDPNNPNTLLAGAKNLWRSSNIKATTPTWGVIKPPFSSTFVSAVAIAPGNSDVIWAGHEDGSVYATLNGTDPSPFWRRMDEGSPGLPNRCCTRITISPDNANRVYVTFGGFSSGNVWRTTDGGTRWTDISGNLPQAPVSSLIIHPHVGNYLYLGTEVGVFASMDDGTSWSPSNDGPANVAVDELFWLGEKIVAATHGRGCYAIRPTFWVQYGLVDPGDGTRARPYNTLARATNAVPPGGTILFKYPGSTPETMTIAKPMTRSRCSHLR